jgi:hypothetical protein
LLFILSFSYILTERVWLKEEEMKYIRAFGLLSVILLTAVFTAGALEVAVEEIENVTPVEFINYSGPVTVNESAEEIRAIGAALARMANFDAQQHTINNKYSVIEVTNNNNDGLYSAAIISIDPDARVDNIRNVRQIVAGYLQGEFNYNTRDANTLSYFLSFYNAIHRGGVDYLRRHYKPEIFNYMDASNAGIARIYSEWPGQTRFVIPLTPGSSMSISALGGEVTQAARENSPDMAIPQRESLNTMRGEAITQNEETIAQNEEAIAQNEAVIAEQQQQAQQAQQQAQQAQQQAEETQQQAQQAQQQAQQARENADEAQRRADEAAAAGSPEAEQLQREADQARQQADEAQQQAEETQQQADEAQQQADEKQQQAQQAQQQADNTAQDTEQRRNQNNQMQQQNEQIRQQQREENRALERDRAIAAARQNPQATAEALVEAQQQLDGASPIVGDLFYFMDVSERFQNGHYHNRILAINPLEGSVVASTTIDVCSREFLAFSRGVVAITAMDNRHASGHDLTLFDLKTLEPIASSKDHNIYWNSFVVNDGALIYAVIVEENKFYLARFNEDFELEARSTDELDADTSITVYKDKVYVTLSGRRQIVVLNKSDLTTVSKIDLRR